MTWQWSINMTKVLWCRFQQCLGTFAMLLAKGFSQTLLFRHLSHNDFRVRNFKITKSMRASFLSKCSKFYVDLKNAQENSEEVSSLRDNCIWIGIVKFSLSRWGYFSLTANALTSSPKICHVNKGEFFQLSWHFSDQTIG